MSKTETKPSIKAKIDQLNSDVEWFYGEDFALDQALEKYQTATKLAETIEQDLDQLQNQVEVIADFTQE